MAEICYAIAVSLVEVRKGLAELRTGLQSVSGALHSHFEDTLDNLTSDDAYPIKMFKFVHTAEQAVRSLADRVTLAETAFSSVLTRFGEDDKAAAMTTNEFFTTISVFVSSYKVKHIHDISVSRMGNKD